MPILSNALLLSVPKSASVMRMCWNEWVGEKIFFKRAHNDHAKCHRHPAVLVIGGAHKIM